MATYNLTFHSSFHTEDVGWTEETVQVSDINSFNVINTIVLSSCSGGINTGNVDSVSMTWSADEIQGTIHLIGLSSDTDYNVTFNFTVDGSCLEATEWLKRYFWKDGQRPTNASQGIVTNSWKESTLTPSAWKVSSETKQENTPVATYYDAVGEYRGLPSYIQSQLVTEYPTWRCAIKVIYQGAHKRDTTLNDGSNRGSWQWTTPLTHNGRIKHPQRYGNSVGVVNENTRTPMHLTSLSETWEYDIDPATWTNDTEVQHMSISGTPATDYSGYAYGVPPEYRQVGWRDATILNGGFIDKGSNGFFFDKNFYTWTSETTTISGTTATVSPHRWLITNVEEQLTAQMLLSDGSVNLMSGVEDNDITYLPNTFRNFVAHFFAKNRNTSRFNYTLALIFYKDHKPDKVIYSPLRTIEREGYPYTLNLHASYRPKTFTCNSRWEDDDDYVDYYAQVSCTIPANVSRNFTAKLWSKWRGGHDWEQDSLTISSWSGNVVNFAEVFVSESPDGHSTPSYLYIEITPIVD